MPAFESDAEAQERFGSLLRAIAADSDLGPQAREADAVVQLALRHPDATVTADLRAGRGVRVDTGSSGLSPDVVLAMDGDVAHQLFGGELNPLVAMAHGKVRTKGSTAKVLRLVPLIAAAAPRYREWVEGGFPEVAEEAPAEAPAAAPAEGEAAPAEPADAAAEPADAAAEPAPVAEPEAPVAPPAEEPAAAAAEAPAPEEAATEEEAPASEAPANAAAEPAPVAEPEAPVAPPAEEPAAAAEEAPAPEEAATEEEAPASEAAADADAAPDGADAAPDGEQRES